jgi:hypothetical protein
VIRVQHGWADGHTVRVSETDEVDDTAVRGSSRWGAYGEVMLRFQLLEMSYWSILAARKPRGNEPRPAHREADRVGSADRRATDQGAWPAGRPARRGDDCGEHQEPVGASVPPGAGRGRGKDRRVRAAAECLHAGAGWPCRRVFCLLAGEGGECGAEVFEGGSLVGVGVEAGVDGVGYLGG